MSLFLEGPLLEYIWSMTVWFCKLAGVMLTCHEHFSLGAGRKTFGSQNRSTFINLGKDQLSRPWQYSSMAAQARSVLNPTLTLPLTLPLPLTLTLYP